MRRALEVTAINPVSQRLVEITLVAETAAQARLIAAQCGLRQVIVRLSPLPLIEAGLREDPGPRAE